MCILLDGQRRAHETSVSAGRLDWMPPVHAEDSIYEAERKEADACPHRQRDLEAAVANLQLGPLAARVHEILDQHHAALPPISEQDDDDRVWRLAIHRMDLRQYAITKSAAEDATATDEATAPEPARRYLHLDLKEPEPDVKEMADKSAARFEAMNARLGLLMWGLHVFKHEDRATYDPTQWRQRLVQARSADAASLGDEEPDAVRGGPGVVAAVCVHDHWQEMSDDEQDGPSIHMCAEVIGTQRCGTVVRVCSSTTCWPIVLVPGCCRCCSPNLSPSTATARPRSVCDCLDSCDRRGAVVRRVGSCHTAVVHRSRVDLPMRKYTCDGGDSRPAGARRWKERPYRERRQLDDIEAKAARIVRQRFCR